MTVHDSPTRFMTGHGGLRERAHEPSHGRSPVAFVTRRDPAWAVFLAAFLSAS